MGLGVGRIVVVVSVAVVLVLLAMVVACVYVCAYMRALIPRARMSACMAHTCQKAYGCAQNAIICARSPSLSARERAN